MHTGQIRILLVEADTRRRQAFREAMDASGMRWSLQECETALHAASLLAEKNGTFDIVVTAQQLPDTSGLELFRRAGALDDPPPFLMTTDTGSVNAAAEALEEGVSDYLFTDPPEAYQALLPAIVRKVVERAAESRFRQEAGNRRMSARQDLEEEVRRRTRQLVRTNRRLKQEIEERKRLEDDLRRIEEQSMLFLEHFPGMVYLKDSRGRFLYINQYIEDAYGLKVEACLGRTVQDILPGDTAVKIVEDDRQVLTSGKELQKIEDVSIGGQSIALFTQKFPILQAGSASMLGGISIDITGHRRAEQENRLLVSAVEHTSESVLILDSMGRIIYINQAGEHSLEMSRDDLRGRPYTMFVSPETDSGPSFSLEKIQDRPWRETIQRVRKDGGLRNINVLVSPLDDDSGAITHYAVIELDVTEERTMQMALEKKRRMEALGMLAGGIAHDFINILQPILINAELIEDMLPADAPEREYVAQIIEASKIGRKITNQIKLFGSRKKQLFHPVILEEVVREAMTIIRRSLPPTIDLRQRISARGIPVRTDAAQVYQLVTNLCTNAVQAMGEGSGKLSVSLTSTRVRTPVKAVVSDLAPGEYLKLTVRDTGRGMNPEIIDQIFDPIFTTKKSSSGTGLGLGVVHSVVKNAGGSIIVHSAPGKGSTFEIYFPVHRGDPEHRTAGNVHAGARRKGRILLVDDNVPELRSVHRMLVLLGFRVSSTNDPAKAVDLFNAAPESFDLVITDQLMPVMNGREMASAMRRVRSGLPVIICSGSEEAIREIRSTDESFSFLISKPFSSQELHDAICRALGGGALHFRETVL